MVDNYTDTDDDGTDEQEDFKNLRAKAKKADALERENAQIKRELAFSKAGIPLDDPKIGYFVKGYDGDLEPAVIRQAAVEAGFITVEQPADPAIDQSRQGQDRVVAASVGTDSAFSADSYDYAMREAYAQGGLGGLSSVTQQYGVTFDPEEV